MALPQIDLLLHGFGTDYANGTATAYKAGTTTLATWYSDAAATTPAANPYTLSASGTATLYCADRLKIDVKNSNGVSAPGFPVDNLGFGVYAPDSWIMADDYANISDAITAAANSTLYFPPGTYAVTANTTIPSTVSVQVSHGAALSITSGKTLTINGSFQCGVFQCFSGLGTVLFASGAVDAVYPEWFGAVGDGVTNDTAAIQKCFDSAPAQGSDIAELQGFVVKFSPRSYIMEEVKPVAGTIVLGSGFSTKFQPYNDGPCIDLTSVKGPQTKIKDIAFISGTTGNEYAIWTYDSNGIWITDCLFFGYIGIHLKSCTDVIVSNNFFDGTTYGVIVGTSGGGDNPFGIQILNNNFFNNANAIKCNAINHSVISNNYFYKLDNVGVSMDIVSDGGLVISGNSFYPTGTTSSTSTFINMDVSTGFSITGNVVYGSVKNAVKFGGGSASRFNISGNVFKTTEEAIYAPVGDVGTITGNVIETTDNARSLYLLINDTAISGNSIKSTYSGTTTTVTLAGDDNTFVGNVLYPTSTTNALLLPTGASGNIIGNNKFDGTYTYDVVDTDGSNFVTPTMFRLSATVDPASISNGSTVTTNVILPGTAFGDSVAIAPPYDLQGCEVSAYVQSSNNVSLVIRNDTGSAKDFASGTWKFIIQRY